MAKWATHSTKGPSPREFHSSVLIEADMIIFGGCNNDKNKVFEDMWGFDISNSHFLSFILFIYYSSFSALAEIEIQRNTHSKIWSFCFIMEAFHYYVS